MCVRRKGWLRNVCAQEGLVKECVCAGGTKRGKLGNDLGKWTISSFMGRTEKARGLVFF
jgi:hypothetical protein